MNNNLKMIIKELVTTKFFSVTSDRGVTCNYCGVHEFEGEEGEPAPPPKTTPKTVAMRIKHKEHCVYRLALLENEKLEFPHKIY